MALYSYNNAFPVELPESLVVGGGSVVLPGLSNSELVGLGFSGPFEFPSYDPNTQYFYWSGTNFVVDDLNQSTIDDNKKETQKFRNFYVGISTSNIKETITQNLTNRLTGTASTTYAGFVTSHLAFVGLSRKFSDIDSRYLPTGGEDLFGQFYDGLRGIYVNSGISSDQQIELDNILVKAGIQTIGSITTDRNLYLNPGMAGVVGVAYSSWYLDTTGTTYLCPLGPAPDNGISTTYYWDEVGYQNDSGDPKTVGWTTIAP
jgi:hypothetical protein